MSQDHHVPDFPPDSPSEHPITDPLDTSDPSQSAAQLKNKGNQCFRDGDYERAIDLYTAAIDLCPESSGTERSVLLSNRAAARTHLTPDDLDSIIRDCSQSLELDDQYLKPLRRRAHAYRQMGSEKLDAALTDFQKILSLDPSDVSAKRTVFELEAEISERNERMKNEMLSKLKDLGDAVLRPFGLSTNNFQLNPNESGGYSVNFKPADGPTQT